MGKTCAALAIFLVLIGGCTPSSPKETPSPEQPVASTAAADRAKSIREGLRGAYRLAPDRRLMLAVDGLRSFITGDRSEPATARFAGGEWTITCGGKEVGRLPEMPDFSDFLILLDGWAKVLLEEHPLALNSEIPASEEDAITEELNKFWAEHAAAAARKVDILWGQGLRNPALLQAGTRALTLLAAQSLDRMETADELPAKALAVLALTKAATEEPVAREEALLAYAMGYSTHAAKAAQTLDAADPARLFVTHDEKGLDALIQAHPDSLELRYLMASLLAARGAPEELGQYVESPHFQDRITTLPIYKLLLDTNTYLADEMVSASLPQTVMVALAHDQGLLPEDVAKFIARVRAGHATEQEIARVGRVIATIAGSTPQSLLSNFEQGLAVLEERYSGPFLDSQTYGAFYQGYFFSGFYILGLHLLDSHSSAEVAGLFSQLIGEGDGGTAGDFRRWFNSLVRAKGGATRIAELISDVAELDEFGAPPLMRTFEEQRDYLAYGSPALLSAIKRLVPHMDSRVNHREFLARTAWKDLYHLPLSQRLYESVEAAAAIQNPDITAWNAYLRRDWDALWEELRNPLCSLETAKASLGYVDNADQAPGDAIHAIYLRLIREYPDDWTLRDGYASLLQKAGLVEEARGLLQEWLERGVSTGGLEPHITHARIAQLYKEEGRCQEGLDQLESYLSTNQSTVLVAAVDMMECLGAERQTEEMARRLVARFPDSLNLRMKLVATYWRHGNHRRAAAALKQSPKPITMDDWLFQVGAVFADVFAESSGEEAGKAFAELRAAKLSNFGIAQLAIEVNEAGHPGMAFALLSTIQEPSFGRFDLFIDCYRFLKASKGQEEALAWLRKTVIHPQDFHCMPMMAYPNDLPEVLWDFVGAPLPDDHQYFTWLMRAAASVRSGGDSDPHRAELLAHYKDPTSNYYDTAARYLLGLASEEDVLAEANSPKRLCELSYYIGLKAQSEGRYQDAADWYRICIETGQRRNGEYRWALDQLILWRGKAKSLSLLAAEKG